VVSTDGQGKGTGGMKLAKSGGGPAHRRKIQPAATTPLITQVRTTRGDVMGQRHGKCCPGVKMRSPQMKKIRNGTRRGEVVGYRLQDCITPGSTLGIRRTGGKERKLANQRLCHRDPPKNGENQGNKKPWEGLGGRISEKKNKK